MHLVPRAFCSLTAVAGACVRAQVPRTFLELSRVAGVGCDTVLEHGQSAIDQINTYLAASGLVAPGARPPPPLPDCPSCSARMVVREGLHGRFIGCSGFGSTGCKGTRQLWEAGLAAQPVLSAEQQAIAAVRCPRCRAGVVKRTPANGASFLGCVDFFSRGCKGAVQLAQAGLAPEPAAAWSTQLLVDLLTRQSIGGGRCMGEIWHRAPGGRQGAWGCPRKGNLRECLGEYGFFFGCDQKCGYKASRDKHAKTVAESLPLVDLLAGATNGGKHGLSFQSRLGLLPLKQLQSHCMRQGVSHTGTKLELSARVWFSQPQQRQEQQQKQRQEQQQTQRQEQQQKQQQKQQLQLRTPASSPFAAWAAAARATFTTAPSASAATPAPAAAAAGAAAPAKRAPSMSPAGTAGAAAGAHQKACSATAKAKAEPAGARQKAAAASKTGAAAAVKAKAAQVKEPAAKEPAAMKVAELRAALAGRGLDSRGLKAALVSRLEEAASAAARTQAQAAAEPKVQMEVEVAVEVEEKAEKVVEVVSRRLPGSEEKAEAESAAETTPPLVGRRVTLRGLQSAAAQRRNGTRGLVQSFDAARGRFAVLLDADGAVMVLKPANREAYTTNLEAAAACLEVAAANLQGIDDYMCRMQRRSQSRRQSRRSKAIRLSIFVDFLNS